MKLGLLPEIMELVLYGSLLCCVIWLFTPTAFHWLTSKRHLSLFVFCICAGIFLGTYILRQTCLGFLLDCSSTGEVHVELVPGIFNKDCQTCVSSGGEIPNYLKVNHFRGKYELYVTFTSILGGMLGCAILFLKRSK